MTEENLQIKEPLYLIDTHGHIDYKDYNDDFDNMLARAKSIGVKKVIQIGCWKKEGGFGNSIEIAKTHDNVFLTLGVHPHEAELIKDKSPYKIIEENYKDAEVGKKLVAIGECGLDYFYHKETAKIENQKEVFKDHIELAKKLNLPLIVHTRDAEEDTIEILKEMKAEQVGGVIHCFSGTDYLAQEAMKLNFYISFSGIITFKKSTELQDVVRKVPIEKTLVETDCPYLAPTPYRGKRNEPSYVIHTAQKVAELKGLSLEDVARITTFNAGEVFPALSDEKGEGKLVYPIRDSLYISLTNKCTNYCTFCGKFKDYTVKGHNLKLKKEPVAKEILKEIEPYLKEEKYKEVVFCGYGEPLLRLDLLKEVGLALKEKGQRIRINTDGMANMVYRRDITPELDFVDEISVSLNAHDSETFQEIVKSPFKEKAWDGIKDFILKCKEHIETVDATVVAMDCVDVEKAKKIVEEELGVNFRSRPYNDIG